MNDTVKSESRGIAFAKVLLLVYGTVMLLWPLAGAIPLSVAALAALIAGLGGRAAWKASLKTHVVITVSLVTLLFGTVLSHWVRSSFWALQWLDAQSTVLLSDCVQFGMGTASLIFALRFASSKRHAWGILEAAFVVGAVAHLFARHRNLSFHRPRFLTDWALVNNIDPQLLLQSVGIGVALIAILMALRAQRGSKLIITLVALLLIGFLVYQGSENLRIEPPIADFLAGDGDQKGEKNEGGGQADNNENQDGESGGSGDGSGGGSSGDPPLPVAVALLHGNYEPEHGLLYFRQQVLSHFNGTRLVADRTGLYDGDVIQSFPHRESVVAAPTQQESYHLRVPTSMFLMVDHPQPFALGASTEIRPRTNPNPRRFVTAYDAVSLVPSTPVHRLVGRASISPDWSEKKIAHYLSFPDDPRYSSLSEEISREIDLRYVGDPLLTALTIKRFLEREGFYTRKERHVGADDPAGSFLFGNRKGYCVHFAHAAAHLFRAQGIAARVAVGYAVDTRMRGGGSAVLIMGNRAHAWPEIHLDGVGWITFDIYPEASDEPPPQLVSQSLESLLGEIARDDPSGGRNADPEAEAFSIPWIQIGQGTLLGVLLILIVAYSIKFWRVLAPVLKPSEHLRAFVSILDRFSDLGHAREYGETRERYAERLTELSPSFVLLTETHLRLSLGHGGDDDTLAMADLCELVRDELNAAVPFWMRIIGWINPWGWWFTR